MSHCCIACSMPLIDPADCSHGDLLSPACVHCTDAHGNIKPCEEIFEGGVQFFIQATGLPRDMALRIVRKNMKALPYWDGNTSECLLGDVATDEEFEAVLSQL